MTYLSHSSKTTQTAAQFVRWIMKNAACQTTHWSIPTSSTYICPSKLPSHLICVTIQQKPGLSRPVSKGVAWHCPSSSCSKNSSAYDVINGIPASANQWVSSCHVTANAQRCLAISVFIQVSLGFYKNHGIKSTLSHGSVFNEFWTKCGIRSSHKAFRLILMLAKWNQAYITTLGKSIQCIMPLVWQYLGYLNNERNITSTTKIFDRF